MSSTLTVNTKITNPFPGLRAFNIDESHLFFGREGHQGFTMPEKPQSIVVGGTEPYLIRSAEE